MVNPQAKMCSDLKEAFRKLAEIEGLLQNSRPHLLKAQEALVENKKKGQEEAAEVLSEIREGKLAEKVSKMESKTRKDVYERNLEDTKLLKEDVTRDSQDSLKDISKLNKK